MSVLRFQGKLLFDIFGGIYGSFREGLVGSILSIFSFFFAVSCQWILKSKNKEGFPGILRAFWAFFDSFQIGAVSFDSNRKLKMQREAFKQKPKMVKMNFSNTVNEKVNRISS